MENEKLIKDNMRSLTVLGCSCLTNHKIILNMKLKWHCFKKLMNNFKPTGINIVLVKSHLLCIYF